MSAYSPVKLRVSTAVSVLWRRRQQSRAAADPQAVGAHAALRLSSVVTLLHATQTRTVCAPSKILAQGLGQFVLKFWAKIRRGSRRSCKLNTTGKKIWRFSTNISLYFANGTGYNGRRIETRMQSIAWCHFQAPFGFGFFEFWLAVWFSGNALASINVVALRQTRLVPGWVTVCERVNRTRYVTSQLGRLSLLPSVGR